MYNNQKQLFQMTAQQTGLILDEEAGCLFGYYGGYQMVLLPMSNTLQVQIFLSVSRTGIAPDAESAKNLARQNKGLLSGKASGFELVFVSRPAGNAKKSAEKLVEALSAIVSFLSSGGYENCCEKCGQTQSTECYLVGGVPRLLCPECFGAMSMAVEEAHVQQQNKTEHILPGIAGALLGSLLGAAAILLISRLGYVSIFPGILMGVCAIKGYEILGGKLTVKGVIFSIVLMILMTYVADRVDWGFIIAKELDTDVITGFRVLPEILRRGMIEASDYYKNLGLLMFYTLLGAIPTAIGLLRDKTHPAYTGKLYQR
ncbi:MAG: hypothetical protein IKS07_04880 [Lachnospiraceae bacterium]|nr:hypothetical protein [Lachnospiraceae bacterium]